MYEGTEYGIFMDLLEYDLIKGNVGGLCDLLDLSFNINYRRG